MKYLIVYERASRELDNAILLKTYLEEIAGHQCAIAHFYDATKFNLCQSKKFDVILVPHLYNTSSIYRVFSRFGISHLYNLQYEQVLSQKWENLGHHNPRNEAKKLTHMCWGEATRTRLINAGIPKENLHLVAPLHMDLLREEYRSDSISKKREIQQKYPELPICKEWILFISSFTYADIEDERLAMNENVSGAKLSEFKEIHTESRNRIIQWFEKILAQGNETILIYRPHPDELSLAPLYQLQSKYNNFKIVREMAVKEWISACDKIFTWYSTSIVESHFLGKPYGVLRPVRLPDFFDSVLIKKAKFIENFQEFEDYYLGKKNLDFAISSTDINQYYIVNQERPTFYLLNKKLEELAVQPLPIYNISFKSKVKAYLTTIAVYLMYHLYLWSPVNLQKYRENESLKRGFVIRWFLEFDNQRINSKEMEIRVQQIRNLISDEQY